MDNLNININSDPFESLLKRFDGVARGIKRYILNRKNKNEKTMESFQYALSVFEQLEIELPEEARYAWAIDTIEKLQGIENLSSVIQGARIPGDPKVDDIDDEWFSAFVNSSKKAFSNWSRVMYSDILSKELENPSSISVLTLSKLMQLGEKDFEAFLRVCSTCYFDNNRVVVDPLILSLDKQLLSMFDMKKDQLFLLEEIGLIKISKKPFLKNFENYYGTQNAFPIKIKNRIVRKGNISHYTYELDFRDCSQEFCGVVVPPGNNNAFKLRELAFFGYVQFSQAGRELANTIDFSLINLEVPLEYLRQGMKYFASEQQEQLVEYLQQQ